VNSGALEPGYVLHSRAYRETSLLLEMLVGNGGRIGLIARGARRSKRSRNGLLQPFVPLLVAWRGRGELPVLTECERQPEQGASLPADRLALGLYLNELLVRLLPRGGEHERLFEYYSRALAELRELDDAEPTLRRFELQLLQELGYGMAFEYDAQSGQLVVPDGLYLVEIERGPVAIGKRLHSELCVSGASLLALAQGRFQDDQQRRECRGLMAAIIRHYLGGVAPRSRQLFKKVWSETR
jgi:DNA repair protein RecO (recombination protein O)